MVSPSSEQSQPLAATGRRVVLLLALLLALVLAGSARVVDPPGNDYLLHGMMIDRAADTLSSEGWASFQDPWFPELNGGAALFRAYPHLPHQVLSLASVATGSDPWQLLSLGVFLGVLLLPLCFYTGARTLGLSQSTAALSALAAVTFRCMDPYGHDLFSYGPDGKGLFGQLWGMNLAALALPAALAAVLPGGGGLSRWTPWARALLAALLLSLTIRTNLPAAWVTLVCLGAALLSLGERRELLARLFRSLPVLAGALLLSLGFLVPFLQDLPTAPSSSIEMAPGLRLGLGGVETMRRLLDGYFFDGDQPGLWTPLFLLALIAPTFHFFGYRRWGPRLRALSMAGIASLLLLFGRAFWGGWLGELPLLGRFHDHRYLLGLQLVAPWLCASVLVGALERARLFVGPRGTSLLVGALVILSFSPTLPLIKGESAQAARLQGDFDASRPLLDGFVAQTEQDLPHRVALARSDGMIGGTTWLSWLRHEGALTMGRPLHHYQQVYDFSLWWTAWVANEKNQRDRALHPDDLTAAGVVRLLDPRISGTTVRGSGPRLVRSDLLLRTESSNLGGLAIRWFQEGLHLRRQYPAIKIGGSALPGGDWLRHMELTEAGPEVLAGLPAGGDELGRVLRTSRRHPGERHISVDVQEEDAWLLIPEGWHPRWELLVDGNLRAYAMLLPGWVGVPLEVGQHEIILRWPSHQGRGFLAALSLLLHLLVIALIRQHSGH